MTIEDKTLGYLKDISNQIYELSEIIELFLEDYRSLYFNKANLTRIWEKEEKEREIRMKGE